VRGRCRGVLVVTVKTVTVRNRVLMVVTTLYMYTPVTVVILCYTGSTD
jgi:hypothetical protein